MRIFGKRKDYYDSAINEDGRTWFREFNVFDLAPITTRNYRGERSDGVIENVKDSIKIKAAVRKIMRFNIDLNKRYEKNGYDKDVCINNGVIVFCGVAYPFIKFQESLSSSYEVFYDYESLTRYLDSKGLSSLTNESLRNFDDQKEWFARSSFKDIANSLFDFKADVDFNSLHVEFDSPILIFDQTCRRVCFAETEFMFDTENNTRHDTSGLYLITGGALADYQFVKKFVPPIAMQEIEMFFGNVMLEKDPISTPSNKVKIESHGFDNKTSFRKGKTKNK